MAQPTTTVEVFFGNSATGDGLFQLNSSLLDGADVLGGDLGTDVTADVNSVSFRRGRPSQLFEVIDPATGTVQLNNELRTYDPMYSAGTHYGFIKPGLRAVVTSNGITVFDAKVADWNLDYQVSGRSTAMMELEDALAVLGRQEFDEWTTTASQTGGPRLADVLNRDEVGWSGGARDLDTGVSVLQDDLVTWGSNVLNYCQLVAQSDLGQFFASRDGLITFRDRHSNLGSTPSAEFADDGTGIAFQSVASTFGAEVYFTRVIVDRENGIAQAATVASAAEDGVRSLTITGVLQDSDTQALDMAVFLATVYSAGDTRLSMVRVALDDRLLSLAQITQVLQLDINSLVQVTFTPNGVGDPIVQSCVVQGIDHDITPDSHWVTLWLSKYDQSNPFILDESVLDGTVDVLSF